MKIGVNDALENVSKHISIQKPTQNVDTKTQSIYSIQDRLDLDSHQELSSNYDSDGKTEKSSKSVVTDSSRELISDDVSDDKSLVEELEKQLEKLTKQLKSAKDEETRQRINVMIMQIMAQIASLEQQGA